jgi:hypothetical protein
MKELDEEIKGRGSVKGKTMKCIIRSSFGYVYKCTGENFNTHYEVFGRRENSYYNCISYPGDEAFGKWAWTYSSLEDAMSKYEDIADAAKEKELENV